MPLIINQLTNRPHPVTKNRPMKHLKPLLILFAAFCMLSSFVSAQGTEKKKVFEFYVIGKLTSEDAASIDRVMTSKKGISECKTDTGKGKVIVKGDPQLDFVALRTVMNYLGYEVTEENLVIREE